MNEILNIIKKRFACRKFADKSINSHILDRIAEAAAQSPSAMNRQPWQIAIVHNKALLDEIESEGLRAISELCDKTIYERIKSRGGKLFYNASTVAFIGIDNYGQMSKVDLGIVAQNICLAATSLGLDSCHCGLVAYCFSESKSGQFKAKLSIPENFECGYGVLLGYALEKGIPHTPDMTKINLII